MTGIEHMQPMLPDDTTETRDAIFDLVASAGSFGAGLNPALKASIGDLVRSMNCYYSNLIEGHNTKLIDIQRALANDYSKEPKKRNFQLEAKAHIEVQQVIDRGEMPYPALSIEGVQWMHQEFCERLPEELLTNTDPTTGEAILMIPGEFRRYHATVGMHVTPEPEAIETLMRGWVEAYGSRMLSKDRRVLGIAAAHHRLVWIHPFMDGNGRVSRLISHAMFREQGIGSELWSVARGLARQVSRYKSLLQAADEPRRGSLDGRGNLTERGLADFCEFFLQQSLDQVRFMQSLLKPSELINRVKVWTDEEVAAKRLPKGAWPILREAIVFGDIARSKASELTGYQERQARTVLAELQTAGLLASSTPKGPLRLTIPSRVVERWFPGLYEPQPEPHPEEGSETEPSYSPRTL